MLSRHMIFIPLQTQSLTSSLQDWSSCLLEQVSRGDLEQAAAAANTPAAGRRRSLPAAYSISSSAGKQPGTPPAAGFAGAPAAAAAAAGGAGGLVELTGDLAQPQDAAGEGDMIV
jgi:hypothetical protein